MSQAVRLLEYGELPQWDQYVLDHPHGSIFHTSSMLRCQSATKDHYPFAYGAVTDDGQLCAVLVASRVVTSSGLGLPLASRSVLYAEPLASPTEEGSRGLKLLLSEHDRQMQGRVLFAEVRPLYPAVGVDRVLTEQGYEHLGYLNYELDLEPDIDALFSRLGPKRRNNVRAAARRGVQVRECEGDVGTQQLYAMLTESYAASRLPMVDRSIFEAAQQEWSRDTYRVYVAYLDEHLVAAACFLTYKRRVICWFAGTVRVPGVSATSSVFWEAMRAYALEGYDLFDLAGGGWEGEGYGPGRFKAKFGGREVNYGRYRKVFSPWKFRVASAVYDQVRRYIAPKSALLGRGERCQDIHQEPLS